LGHFVGLFCPWLGSFCITSAHIRPPTQQPNNPADGLYRLFASSSGEGSSQRRRVGAFHLKNGLHILFGLYSIYCAVNHFI